jgi:hypothetical protein
VSGSAAMLATVRLMAAPAPKMTASLDSGRPVLMTADDHVAAFGSPEAAAPAESRISGGSAVPASRAIGQGPAPLRASSLPAASPPLAALSDFARQSAIREAENARRQAANERRRGELDAIRGQQQRERGLREAENARRQAAHERLLGELAAAQGQQQAARERDQGMREVNRAVQRGLHGLGDELRAAVRGQMAASGAVVQTDAMRIESRDPQPVAAPRSVTQTGAGWLIRSADGAVVETGSPPRTAR